MAGQPIADPRADQNDRYAGVNGVRSTISGARVEPGLLVAEQNTDKPSYVVSFNVAPTVAMDVFSMNPSGSKVLRVRRIVLVNPGSATAAIVVDLQLGFAIGGIGSGGTTPTPVIVDQANRQAGQGGGPDSAAIGTFHVGDTTLAGAFVQVPYNPLVSVAVPAAAGGFAPLTIYDARDDKFKALTDTSAFGVVALRIAAVGAGAAGFRGYVEFTIEDA